MRRRVASSERLAIMVPVVVIGAVSAVIIRTAPILAHDIERVNVEGEGKDEQCQAERERHERLRRVELEVACELAHDLDR